MLVSALGHVAAKSSTGSKHEHPHVYPGPQEDPKSRSPNNGLQYSYGVDYRTLMWIYFLDPFRVGAVVNVRKR